MLLSLHDHLLYIVYMYMYIHEKYGGWNGSHDCARSRGIAAILRANYAPFLRVKSPFNAKTC